MKFRSYNEQILIAQALIGNIFNDIIIDRRQHGLDRDYSKPISMEDIIQKDIQIPCIFGDRSLILKSLQNESGAIKLPLYIITSKGLKVDLKREADLHIDIFYQMDECFSKLPKDHPAYRPYSLKKRRGLPIIINYDLTLISKYKEDLDQMLTNWMVHWRPDIYVKWWHPKKKTEPLQSEILWDQNINIDANVENDGRSKFQWKATTTFQFKTWLFPGLNYKEDSLESDLEQLGKEYEPIIQKFTIFNNQQDYSKDVEIDQNSGFPVLGDLFDNTDPNTRNTLDTQVISDRNIDLDQVYNYQLSSQNYPGPITDQNWWKDADILYHKYSDYMIMPPIIDNRIQIKYTYFNNAQPLSAMQSNPPSGDILLNIFSKYIKDNRFEIKQREFGDCYSDSLCIQYDYNIVNKQLNVYGQNKANTYYILMKSTNSKDSIQQQLCLSSLSLQENIKFDMIRTLDITNEKCDITNNTFDNIALWNILLDKRQHMNDMKQKDWQLYKQEFQMKSEKYKPKFMIQNKHYQHILNVLRNLFIKHFDNIELQNQQNNTYKLYYANNNFWKITDDLECTRKDFQQLEIKQIIQENKNKYIIIANNWLYIVIKNDQEIYDFGFISLPTFDTVPIFNSTLPQCKVVYGLNTQYKISTIIKPETNPLK